jgi:hypothetical protein
MATLAQNANFITITYSSTDTISINKKEVNTIEQHGDYVYIIHDNGEEKLLYYEVTSPTYATAALLKADLLSWANAVGYATQNFIATLGQTLFTTTFKCTTGSTDVEINGSDTQKVGWTVTVGGAVDYTPSPFTGGELVTVIVH